MSQMCKDSIVLFFGFETFLNKPDSLMERIKHAIDEENDIKWSLLYNIEIIGNTKGSIITGCDSMLSAYFIDLSFSLSQTI